MDTSTAFSFISQNIFHLSPGTYYVLVTANNGCVANDTVTLTICKCWPGHWFALETACY